MDNSELKKTLLRAMIQVKQAEVAEAQAAGQNVVDFIHQINDAEANEEGSSIFLFATTETEWKNDLLMEIGMVGAMKVGKPGSIFRRMLSGFIAGWETTTLADKNKKSGGDEYKRVLGAVLGGLAAEDSTPAAKEPGKSLQEDAIEILDESDKEDSKMPAEDSKPAAKEPDSELSTNESDDAEESDLSL